jgi:Na+-driven multidrug efflux pump
VTIAGGLAGVVFGVLVAAGSGVLPGLFTPDAEVRDQASVIWPWFIALMPFAGVTFALDGVLIGAGDVRFLRNITVLSAVGGFLPAIWLAYWFDLGLGGIWAGLLLLVVIRFVAVVWRWRSGRWAVLGAVRG